MIVYEKKRDEENVQFFFQELGTNIWKNIKQDKQRFQFNLLIYPFFIITFCLWLIFGSSAVHGKIFLGSIISTTKKTINV